MAAEGIWTYQCHATGQSVTHSGVAAELQVLGSFGCLAELGGHGVDLGEARGVDNVRLNQLAILHVHALDGLELAVHGRELSDDGELPRCVDLELGPLAVVVGDVHSVRVPPAAALVAHAVGSALGPLAQIHARHVAGVRRNVGGAPVGLPDVHLVAASALTADIALS